MFVVNEDNSIYATRGDIVFFGVEANDDGASYKFQPGDVVRVTVYGKKNAEEVVLQKDFPVTEVCETVTIYLEKEDTKIGEVISKPKDYWYEVELNPDTEPQTIIGYDEDGARLFRLFPEGDELDEYEPDPEDFPVVDEALDVASPRPVANSAITRELVSLRDECERTREAVTENFVTPLTYGAIADGESDDTEAIQSAIDSGVKVVDLLGRTYHISRAVVLTDGQVLRNGVLDGLSVAARGVECTSTESGVYQRVVIENVTVRNFTEYGIYLKRCSRSMISNCLIENITNTASGAIVRGICLEYCRNTVIQDACIHNIVSDDDADGIHFLQLDTVEDEVYSGNVVRNCVTYDCYKRHIKVQQFGVTLDGCRMLDGPLGINVSSCVVAVYDSYFTMKDCFVDTQASAPVKIGADNEENDHEYRYITFSNNRFCHHGAAYQGVITCTNASECTYRDVIVTGNEFILANTTEYALYLRAEFDRVVFNSNIVSGGNSAVCVRDTEAGGALTVNSNQFDGAFALVYLTSATVAMLCAMDNLVKLASGSRTLYLAGSSVTLGKVSNIRESDVSDFPFTTGSTESRPTIMLYNGYQYFDQTLMKPVFYYNGVWKDATGADA